MFRLIFKQSVRRWATVPCRFLEHSSTIQPKEGSVKRDSLPKVYTRTGDRGTSVLLSSGAQRLSKDALVFDVLGTLDELSSSIGLVLCSCSMSSIREELETIQHHLFDVGACVAASNRSSRFVFNDRTLIDELEKRIDRMTEELPELRNFILPGGGSQTAAFAHLTRAVCRRGERLLTRWLNEQGDEQQQETVMGIYLNRLSDYFFTLARYVTLKEGHQEIIYRKRS